MSKEQVIVYGYKENNYSIDDIRSIFPKSQEQDFDGQKNER